MDSNERFKASKTAIATSLMRALHTRLDHHPLIDDPWGERLVPDPIDAASLRASPAYAGVIMRCRYAEDALRIAVAGGARQYVLIGAGFDSFALRRPAFAHDLEIFEIDHPATQQFKRTRLQDCGLALSSAVHFIAADLATETLGSALSRSAFRRDERAFFSWLGVTMYLTLAANLATLRAVADSAAAGSELVFTYLEERAFASSAEQFLELRRRVAAAGEPFQSGFDPSRLAELLRSTGFELVEDLSERALLDRLDPGHSSGLKAGSFSHVARALTVGH